MKNKKLEVRTIYSINAGIEAATADDNNAHAALVAARHALNQAKEAARKEPDDFNKAKEQAATQEYNTALIVKNATKNALRKANEGKRTFIYGQKPALNARGRTLRY